MKQRLIALTMFLTMWLADSAHAFSVKSSESPSPAEKTAIKELNSYLKKTTKSLSIDGNRNPVLYVGDTEFARKHGVDTAKLANEQWLIKSVDGDVILAGGGTRGTLYAVYSFLENQIGVHWWNPTEEYIPSATDVSLKKLELKGKPFFAMRDYFRSTHDRIDDKGIISIHNRANRNGDIPIPAELGGSYNYGLPYHVHTFKYYIHPNKYFKSNPEYFALRNNQRVKDQLCVSNPEVKELMKKRLHEFIKLDRERANKAGVPYPVIYEVSINDNWVQCQCDKCRAIVAEDNPAGLQLRMINYLADSIKDEYPDIYIGLLAYYFLEELPQKTMPRDNVIIRLCNTRSNQTVGPESPDNKLFYNLVKDWGKVSNKLYIWEYMGSHSEAYGLPLPEEFRIPDLLRFYAKNKVQGVFMQNTVNAADMPSFKNWLFYKFMENPDADFDKLMQTFTDKYYGAAGQWILRYRKTLHEAALKNQYSYIAYDSNAGAAFDYIDLDSMLACWKYCDEAEKAVKDDPTMHLRVLEARLPLDRYLAAFYAYKYMREWERRGNDISSFPFDLDATFARIKSTMEKLIAKTPRDMNALINSPGSRLNSFLKDETRFNMQKTMLEKRTYKLPEKFDDQRAIQIMASTFGYFGSSNIFADKDSPSGFAAKVQATSKTSLALPPCVVAFHGWTKFGSFPGMAINPNQIKDAGYNWYQLGPANIIDLGYLYFTRTWVVQMSIGPTTSIFNGDAVSIWVNLKFEGEDYIPRQKGVSNAVYIERVVITPPTANEKLLSSWEAPRNRLEPGSEPGAIKIKGATTVFASQMTRIELNDTYRLSGSFRLAPDSGKGNVLFGVTMYDEHDLNQIRAHNVLTVKNGVAELARDIAADTKQVYIRASATEPRVGQYLAFDIDDSGNFIDLPNFKTFRIDKVEKGEDSGTYALSLKESPGLERNAGSKVRLHNSAGYLYARSPAPTTQWQSFSHEISGEALDGIPVDKWWKGTSFVKPLILTIGNDVQVEFKDFTLQKMKK